tara:strand:+ start:374 stop:1033 length:660 start_codon:yes stop_codon:yes gene_type:complete
MQVHDIAVHLGPAQAHLRQLDDDWAGLIDRVGDCRLTTAVERSPYESLSRAVAYQQLHGKAAAAIVGRLTALFPGQDFPRPRQLFELPSEELRACGFSARKQATLKGLAEAALDGRIPDREQAAEMEDEELIKRFTAIKGIGRWTVEMMLINTLGRPDILPVDDFGIRDGARYLFGWERMPTPRETRELCEPCRPWRSVASWYLWRCNEQPDYRRLAKS